MGCASSTPAVEEDKFASKSSKSGKQPSVSERKAVLLRSMSKLGHSGARIRAQGGLNGQRCRAWKLCVCHAGHGALVSLAGPSSSCARNSVLHGPPAPKPGLPSAACAQLHHRQGNASKCAEMGHPGGPAGGMTRVPPSVSKQYSVLLV